jgi:AcrR family transcriptional regulator
MAKRSYHHGNLRVALVKAALKAIAEDGPDKLSLRDVARRAGVSAAAVYRHFHDKDDLLVAVAVECADRIGAVMAEALADAPADPLERFRATGIAYVRFAVEHPEHFRALGIPGLFDRMPAERAARETARQAERVRALVEAQDAGQLAQLPSPEILLAAEAQVVGLAHMIIEGRFGPVDAARATELAIAVTRALAVGFVPRPEALEDPRDGVVIPAAQNVSRSWSAGRGHAKK